MKKNQAVKLCIKLILVVCTFVFSGCVKNSAKTEDSKIKIVATIFPEYDWLMNVIGSKSENFEATLLLDKGTDLHNYQPSASDIMKLAKADMFVYVGGESDEWVCDALREAGFATVKFLADKTEQLGLSCVCTIEKSDKKVANAVISNTRSKNQQIVEFDSIEKKFRLCSF